MYELPSWLNLYKQHWKHVELYNRLIFNLRDRLVLNSSQGLFLTNNNHDLIVMPTFNFYKYYCPNRMLSVSCW